MTARRIVLVANSIDEIGGVQRVVEVLAQGFSGRGHDVDVVGISPTDRGLAHSFVDDPAYGRHVLYPAAPPRWRPANTFGSMASPVRLRESHVRNRMRSEAHAALARLLAGPPGVVVSAQLYAMEHLAPVVPPGWLVVGQYHDSYEAASSGSDLVRAREVYRDVDAFLLLTAHDAAAFERAGFANTDVMPNPLGFEPPGVSALDRPVVVSAARYSHQKAHHLLIDAWARVAPSHPTWVLRMFGEGELRDPLARQLVERGVAGSAQLMGPTADLGTELLGASIYAMSSRHEGLPMVLIESMACGVPAVSFDCAPGIREIITDGVDGLVVPPLDVPALAAALARLMDDVALRRRLGSAATSVVDRFGLDRVLDRWEALFEVMER